MSYPTTTFSTIDRARRLPATLGRMASRPLALGALLLAASTATVLATANTPPKIVSASMSPNVLNEGQTAILTVSFTDANPGDSHTLRVKWRDTGPGAPMTEVIQIPPQQTTIQVPHTFKDTPANSAINVTLYDRQTPPGSPNDNTEGAGKDYVKVPVTVNNVAPSLPQPTTVTSSRVSATQVLVKIDGAIADAAGDTHEVRAARWYGSTPAKVTTPCTADKLRYHCELTYSSREVGTVQAVTVYVKDDEGATGAANVTVEIQDAPGS